MTAGPLSDVGNLVASLESPTSTDDLYRYRVDVPITRPIFQGDVFEVANLACLSGNQRAVILTHPCSMRQGVTLRDRLTIARVTTAKPPVGLPWKGHYRIMPLPDLDLGEEFWQIDFEEIHTISSTTLFVAKRIACLEDLGIALLQQRYIYHLTRYKVETKRLYDSSANVMTEVELMEHWVETLVDYDSSDLEEQIKHQQAQFDKYITPFREDLMTESKRASVRRKVYNEAEKRLH